MRTKSEYPFEVDEAVTRLGERLRLARMRRNITQEDLAIRAKITRKTLSEIEKGKAGVTFGNVLTVLWTLGLLDSVKALADPDADQHGRILDSNRHRHRVRYSNSSDLDNDF